MGVKIALLRGINVGGHKKVPMGDLKAHMEQAGYADIQTLLNSGNVIFDQGSLSGTESELEHFLESWFGFEVPVIIRDEKAFHDLLASDPFKDETATKDTRFYISFLKHKPEQHIESNWTSEDGAYKVLKVTDHHVISVLDVSMKQTTKAMEVLESFYGKVNVTTRNWNTLVKIGNKLV